MNFLVDIIIPSQHYKSNRNISYTLKIIKKLFKKEKQSNHDELTI